jgi:hypothetical protein
MVRQAHTYLVGAMGGTTLIGVSIVVFVVLVSAQVFKDWPIAALGGGGEETAAVSSGHPEQSSPAAFTASNSPSAGAAPQRASGGVNGSSVPGGSVARHGGLTTLNGGSNQADSDGGSPSTGSPGPAAAASPNSNAGSGSAGPASSGAGSGSSTGGGGHGSSGGEAGSGAAPPPSGQVAETVNHTVAGVDETALGGALHETGVSEVTESVVNGVAGPESPVGHVVDETAGAVGGLLHGNH